MDRRTAMGSWSGSTFIRQSKPACLYARLWSLSWETEQALPREIFGNHDRYESAKKQARVNLSSMANGVSDLFHKRSDAFFLTIVVFSKREWVPSSLAFPLDVADVWVHTEIMRVTCCMSPFKYIPSRYLINLFVHLRTSKAHLPTLNALVTVDNVHRQSSDFLWTSPIRILSMANGEGSRWISNGTYMNVQRD
jgi:hypothetical protein